MAQRKQISWAQLRVGLLVVVSLVIFAVLVFLMTGEGFFATKYTLHAFMDNAGGLKKGDPVRLAGIDVGNVDQIRVSASHEPLRAVEVIMRVQRRYMEEIRGDSMVTLEAEGLLGQRYVDIVRGTPKAAAVPNGGEVRVNVRPDLGDVVASSATVLTNLNRVITNVNRITSQVESGKGTIGRLVYDESLYARAQSAVNDVQQLVSRAAAGEGSLGKLLLSDDIYNRMNSSVVKVDQIIDDVRGGKGSLGKLLYDTALHDQAQQVITRANNIVGDVEAGKGSLGKIIKDEAFYNRLNSATDKIDNIAGRLDRGEGSVGKMLQDQALYNNMNNFSVELRELLADFRKNPKKFLTINLRIF